EWKHGDTAYVARYLSIFTRFDFFAPKWILVMSEPKANVFAPMADFKKTFFLIFLLSLWIVLLMSFNQIRRSLIPLEKLQEGTRRIAQRDFQTKVTVTSGDEFEELAASFNAMADRLDKQFNTMTIMNEIDRSILSALDTKKIANTVLTRMSEIFLCDCVGLALLKNKKANTGLMYVKDDNPRGRNRLEPIKLTSLEERELYSNPEYALIDANKEIPQYLSPLAGLGMNLFLVLPIFLGERLSAMIALGYRVPMSLADEDHVQARQLADQVAVALSNAQLIEDLEELSWGTLYALARTIDAKSPWTAGHSERVTKLALRIGRVMGLNEKELQDLQRAGLLHDIGKLGIPPEILDKPGDLTHEEHQLMRRHPQMGARILEPIAAYADVTPIVLGHHENYDGSGYPAGLAGDNIVLGARIFALADQFDALTSDRPYRAGLDRKRVIEYIKQRSGQRFDPKVVRAFLHVIRQEQRASQRGNP
ncbi:MAG: HD domain-containing phosphohydrolase, partial [Desulfobacteraceae bacterium]